MNSKKNIDDKIAMKTSAILICGSVFLFINAAFYKVLSAGTATLNGAQMFTIFIVLHILLLLAVFSVLFFLMRKREVHSLLKHLFIFWLGTVFYKVFALVQTYISGISKRLTPNLEKDTDKKNVMQNSISHVNIPCLSSIFSEKEKELIQSTPIEVIGILSYFATSLFEKNNLDEVLWDITENCISQLQLEDCVIYMLDRGKKVLIQKAAFGHKNSGERKVVSPIQISLGEGIVGRVAQTGRFEYIPDVTKDPEYIIDDVHRRSELSVPVFIDDEVVGVLDTEHSQKNFFTASHILLFRLIAKLTEIKLKQIHTKCTLNITDDNAYFKELDFLMRETKIYRDATLGLDSMSEKLNISGNYLSQLVNKLSGCNFADYVNGFRIEDAKAKLKDPEFANYTIISIALESGFNSKSTFYNAFKKLTGILPKEYRQIP